MNDSKISVRYAKALFMSAVEKKLLDKVYDDMIFISELCTVSEVKEVLLSPVIIPSKKKSILFGLLQKNVEPVTLSLVDLLIKNGREDYLPAVSRAFRESTLRHRGITETALITAVPVNEEIRKQISSLVEKVFKNKVELKESVDKNILGGFILRVNDSYIDASVRTKLRNVRKGLSVRTGTKEL